MELEIQQNAVSELNAISNAAKIASSPTIQQAWNNGKPVQVHAWVYQLEFGRLLDLGLDLRLETRDEADRFTNRAMEQVFERLNT